VADADVIENFIARWKGVTASELSTSQSFLIEICELLEVSRPHATAEQDYMFERPLTFHHADGSKSAGRVDLYKRGAFVLESKKFRANTQTKGFDEAMLRAHSQAQNYARALPASEGRPPFVVVVDVGHRIELFSEFSRSGGNYVPFPDPRSHRISLDDLHRPEIRDRLRRIWLDPLSLDPSRESARVTREIAGQLAELAKSLERSGHSPEAVAQFLMRCLFTMFSEDVRLLPSESFRNLLIQHVETPEIAMRMVSQLWRDMDTGGFSAVLANDVLQFNGKLFKQPDTLPLDRPQVELLIKAAKAKWEHVEPAIFGTLLERALSPNERYKLGAHYTPRAYVERLVLPTVIEPLRAEWSDAQAAALTLAAEGKDDEAVKALLRFHHRLCTVRVLDPACGSGNFLYVTLEHLKRLEGEVLGALDDFGYQQTGLALGGERADALGGETVDPHNLLGIELNPRAAAITEVVLWIGYLQWHFRTRGDVHPPTPVIRDFRNIENRDAVLAYDRMEYLLDDAGLPVTRWDGETMKDSPVTGEKIPDESARKPIERYINPRKAEWPRADFVVGNPPFLGNKRMRLALGDGYVESLRKAWKEVPNSSDLVMYWWHHAATLVAKKSLRRAGLITTNSITQTYNRKLIEEALANGTHIVFATPDHPWVEASDGAAVRVAMTVVANQKARGMLAAVTRGSVASEESNLDYTTTAGIINADLSVGADVTSAAQLIANQGMSFMGVTVLGKGFVVSDDEASSIGLGTIPELNSHVSLYRNGNDLIDKPRNVRVIDFFGLDEQAVMSRFPAAYQWILDRVKPERVAKGNTKDGAVYARLWWQFAKPRGQMRHAISGLPRYIATCRTAKHRLFLFLDSDVLPDAKVIAIASSYAETLGILSSVIHVLWASAVGARLGVGNDSNYNNSECFGKFVFPANSDDQTIRIRALAEQLDAHRKRQQAAHPDLTLTGMYNVLEKLRGVETLTPKERTIHEHGLVSVLRQLHDDLDAAVLDAYGWADLLPLLRIGHGNDAPTESQSREDAKRAFDESILERLVALNAERAAEEARGHIHWLRPEFQNPQAHAAPEQATLDTSRSVDDMPASPITTTKPTAWPKDAVEQVRAVADLLASSPVPLSIDDIGNRFTARGPWKRRLPQLLDMLVTLGRAQEVEGQYARSQ
jgi:hypothetical protein